MRSLFSWLRVCCLLIAVGCIELGPPQWSPDGRKVVFTHWRIGAPSDVWLIDLDRRKPSRRLAGPAYSPHWSADGRSVYCIVQGKGERWEIRRITLAEKKGESDTSELFLRLEAGDIRELEITPQGDAVLYLREETVGGVIRRQVWRGSLTEETEMEVTDEGVGVDHFALSPDGAYVAYSTHLKKTDAEGQVSSYNEVHLTASDGSTESMPLISLKSADPARHFRVGFLRRGGRVFAYDGTRRIVTVPMAGGATRTYSVGAAGAQVFGAVSLQDGRSVLATVVGQDRQVAEVLIDVRTGSARRLEMTVGKLLGMRNYDSESRAYARYTASGMQVASSDGSWERYYPLDGEELLSAVGRLGKLDAEHREEALMLVDHALTYKGPVEANVLRRGPLDLGEVHLARCEILLKLKRYPQAQRAFLTGLLAFPVRSGRHDEAGLFERMRPTKEGLLDPLLRAADAARALKVSEAKRLLKKAQDMSAEPDRIAGLEFLKGAAELAALQAPSQARRTGRVGDRAKRASSHFARAASERAFGQRDYAGALEALAFAVGANPRVRLARELILKATDHFPQSVLRDDLVAIGKRLRERPPGAWVSTAEQRSAGLSAVASVRQALKVRYHPLPLLGPDRRRLMLDPLRSEYRIEIRRDQPASSHVIGNLPGPAAHLAISPDRRHVAFAVEREPWQSRGAALCVVDARGRVVHGDVLRSGKIPKGPAIDFVRWDGDGKVIFGTVETRGGKEVRREQTVEIQAAAGAEQAF